MDLFMKAVLESIIPSNAPSDVSKWEPLGQWRISLQVSLARSARPSQICSNNLIYSIKVCLLGRLHGSSGQKKWISYKSAAPGASRVCSSFCWPKSTAYEISTFQFSQRELDAGRLISILAQFNGIFEEIYQNFDGSLRELHAYSI